MLCLPQNQKPHLKGIVMDRREFVAHAVTLPVATAGISIEKKEATKEPEPIWKVVNVPLGQKEPETVQKILNDLETKGYHIVGVEPCTGNQVQIYARTTSFMFNNSIARS